MIIESNGNLIELSRIDKDKMKIKINDNTVEIILEINGAWLLKTIHDLGFELDKPEYDDV
jgi:hypothetical protein